MPKQQLVKKNKDFLSPHFVQLVNEFCQSYKTQQQTHNEPISVIVHLMEQVILHNNNDLQITNMRKCLEPFVSLLQQQQQATSSSTIDDDGSLKSFTRDYLRLLVRLIFCHETKTIHKHILFLFQKFSAAASAASVENSEDVRSMILNEFLSELLVYSNQMLQTSASIEKLEDDLRQFEWLYELDGFFHCELVKLVPQFLSKSYQCLSHHSKLFFTSSNNQQSLFVIGNILKTTVLIITEHLDAITNELTQNMQQKWQE